MEPILTRCGFRCDLCLAYKPNVENHPEKRLELSDGWFKYFGFRIPADEIYCDGCMAETPRLLDQNCPVRPCVIEKGLKNCTECEEYICEKLTERIVIYEDMKRKIGKDIPEDEYICFIRPYENKRRLETYRLTGKIID